MHCSREICWHLWRYRKQHNLCALKNYPSQDLISLPNLTGTRTHNFNKSRLVTQALKIKAKAVYRRIIEDHCVRGSIPPRATKNHQNHLRVVLPILAGLVGRDSPWIMHLVAPEAFLVGRGDANRQARGLKSKIRPFTRRTYFYDNRTTMYREKIQHYLFCKIIRPCRKCTDNDA